MKKLKRRICIQQMVEYKSGFSVQENDKLYKCNRVETNIGTYLSKTKYKLKSEGSKVEPSLQVMGEEVEI
jgi:hypothetical protein